MAHHNTVFSQILKLVPRHEFESLAQEHHEGRKLRKMTRWSQFVSLGLAQLAACVMLSATLRPKPVSCTTWGVVT